MYELADRIDPEAIYALSRFAYAELALAGVTAIGEFHYLHHQPGGTPYGDRIVLADAVVRAARDVGLRITLLRVLYQRAGVGAAADGAQLRFCDHDLDDALADALALESRFAADPLVRIGLAPHSVRAVSRAWIRAAAIESRSRGWPLHMHVAEQRREVEECRAEYRLTPVRMLAEDGVLGELFTAVHATHLEPEECAALGAARCFVCICRTTERDLGDGACPAAQLVAAGARLCTGVDSHAISDPFEEARAIELDERTRAEARHIAADADQLLNAACAGGYAAIGFPGAHMHDRVTLDANDPALAGIGSDPGRLADAVIFAAGPRAVLEVECAGRTLVCDRQLSDLDRIRSEYEATLARLRR
jgi:formiminoglutamate deiminase